MEYTQRNGNALVLSPFYRWRDQGGEGISLSSSSSRLGDNPVTEQQETLKVCHSLIPLFKKKKMTVLKDHSV